MRHSYDLVDDNKLSGYDGIAIAIVLQAVRDWKTLCNCKTPTNDRNFAELENFFKHYCRTFLIIDDVAADAIFAELQKERKKSGF